MFIKGLYMGILLRIQIIKINNDLSF